MSEQKVLVIGLDAACFEQLDPLLDDGVVPNLESLLENGTGVSLESTTPPWTPSAWPSLVTGAEPTIHGIYDFHHYDRGYDAHHVSAREIRIPFLWEYLSAFGLSSIVINVPVTHPAHAFDGSLVPGYIAPEGSDCVVDGISRAISDINETYRIYARETDSREATLNEYERLVESRVEMVNNLTTEHDWSFMMVQFQQTDSVFHSFGDDERAIRRTYRAVDEAIGSLLDIVDDDCTVFIVSDHGIHQYEHVFNCNTWLHDRGFLETTKESERNSWGAQAKAALQESGSEEGKPSLTHRIAKLGLETLSTVGLTPQRGERILSMVGLAESARKVFPNELLLSTADHVDWANSAAYCRSLSSLGIRCNVQGREPNGVVPSDEFDSLRTSLVEALQDIHGPNGKPVFEEVFDRHAVSGSDIPNERSAPDIFVHPRGMSVKVSDVIRDRTFQPTTEYNHTYDGLLVASGPNIEPEADIDPVITDVAPTILRLFGLNTPESMDGHALSELFADMPPSKPCPSPGPRTYFDGADGPPKTNETVQERLRDMGYVE